MVSPFSGNKMQTATRIYSIFPK